MDSMIHLVKKINYIDGYKISITFNDHKTKIVDIEPYLKRGVFLPLKDPEFFKQVKVIGNTLVWPNEADFCPDVLYEIGKDVKKTQTSLIIKSRRMNTERVSFKQPAHALSKKRSKKSTSK